DIKVPGIVYSEAPNASEQGAGGGTVVAAEPTRPSSCHVGDHTARNLADEVTGTVYDVEVAGRRGHGDGTGVKQLGAGGRPIVAPVTIRPIPRHRSYYAA